MDAARPVRDMHLPGGLTATKLRWNLSADKTEQAALLELAEPCAESTVEYEPAS
ncbi:hypothetical protein GCM10010284_68210 [Streptomyces rubiginosohelvolus]|nr:hypothetical protein GCM10010284_68210 [Streptomyces rubiginosohelvolus]